MKEFRYTFQKGLTVGLRTSEVIRRNNEALVELKNARVSQYGLEAYDDISQPFTASVNWPYTSFKQLEDVALLFDETAIYEVNLSTWAKSTLASGITGDLSWHVADYVSYVIATNGSSLYERDPSAGTWSKNTSLPGFKTCDNVNGRLVIGNVSNFYDCDETFVAWSRVGEVTFEPDRKNESGYSPAWCGEVYHVKKFKKGFITYGATGIRGFFQAKQYFGQKEIAKFGIASRDAIAGTEDQHIFLADDGSLWQITGEFKLQKIGYEEFFRSMIGNDVVISYNPNPGEFYISDGNKSYLLYEGLSQVYQIPNGIAFYNGSKVSITDSSHDIAFYLVTTEFDFGVRGFKRLESIELGIDSEVEIYAAVQWRSKKRETWQTTSFKQVNSLGNVYIGVEAVEFRIVLRSYIKADVNLDYINISYKISDRRFIRGVNVS